WEVLPVALQSGRPAALGEWQTSCQSPPARAGRSEENGEGPCDPRAYSTVLRDGPGRTCGSAGGKGPQPAGFAVRGDEPAALSAPPLCGCDTVLSTPRRRRGESPRLGRANAAGPVQHHGRLDGAVGFPEVHGELREPSLPGSLVRQPGVHG